MNNLLSEREKIDFAVVPGTINAAANVTSAYYNMSKYRRALLVLEAGAMALTATSVGKFVQAKDAAGTGAKDITDKAATITANTKVAEATVTLATFLAGGTVTINGLVFTAHATTTTVASRQFSISGDDTADAAALVSCINNGTYGVPGVTASNNAGVVTLKSTVPGETVITVTSSDVPTAAVATTKAIAYVEIEASDLDVANGFTHVAVNAASTVSNIPTAAVLIRGDGSYNPQAQAVAAFA